jgi:hypothetical protein
MPSDPDVDAIDISRGISRLCVALVDSNDVSDIAAELDVGLVDVIDRFAICAHA